MFAFLLARGDRPAARCASPAYIIETSKWTVNTRFVRVDPSLQLMTLTLVDTIHANAHAQHQFSILHSSILQFSAFTTQYSAVNTTWRARTNAKWLMTRQALYTVHCILPGYIKRTKGRKGQKVFRARKTKGRKVKPSTPQLKPKPTKLPEQY